VGEKENMQVSIQISLKIFWRRVWDAPVILALGRLRQEDQELEANLNSM
jgi:hypothetical protein